MESTLRTVNSLAALSMLSVSILASGCSTSLISRGRDDFFAGRMDDAVNSLTEAGSDSQNAILALMERGMAHHIRGDYKLSNSDWIDAHERITKLDYLSISEGAASLIINDATKTYTGAPYERSLLHSYTALNFFAMKQWHEAGVEARLIADGLENLNDFPDDPFSRYIAGLAFEMIRDYSGAKLEYSQANALTKHLFIDEQYGRMAPSSSNQVVALPTQKPGEEELICLIGIGSSPVASGRGRFNRRWGSSPYVEVVHNNTVLGRSYTLTTTAQLWQATQNRIAAIQAAKTVTRIVLKESIANAVAEHNTFLGEILRLVLYALEVPDTRGWATLPMWLQAARVPCPANPGPITLVYRNSAGVEMARRKFTAPFPHRDRKNICLSSAL